MDSKTFGNMFIAEGSGAVYGLGFVGALIYFLQHATNLQDGLMGLLQSIVWPAMLTYKAFELLKF